MSSDTQATEPAEVMPWPGKHGPMATAIHEAGHVLASIWFGVETYAVAFNLSADSGARATAHGAGWPDDPAAIEGEMMMTAAGPAAEARFLGVPVAQVMPLPNSKSDTWHLRKLAQKYLGAIASKAEVDALIDKAIDRAERFVAWRWNMIVLLAEGYCYNDRLIRGTFRAPADPFGFLDTLPAGTVPVVKTTE